jgi:predicted transcriptional regulator
MASVTIRIPSTAHDRAQRLAEEETTTLGAVIDIALERYERERMLEKYNADMARLRADPEAWTDWRAEIASLEGSLMDGLAEYPYEGIANLLVDPSANRDE